MTSKLDEIILPYLNGETHNDKPAMQIKDVKMFADALIEAVKWEMRQITNDEVMPKEMDTTDMR